MKSYFSRLGKSSGGNDSSTWTPPTPTTSSSPRDSRQGHGDTSITDCSPSSYRPNSIPGTFPRDDEPVEQRPQRTGRQDGGELASTFEQLGMRDSGATLSQTSTSRNPNTSRQSTQPMNQNRTSRQSRASHSLNHPSTRTPQSSAGNSAPKNILIAVFGMTGTGKTTLIKNLAGTAAKRLRTGHGLESCTQDIDTVECSLGGRSVTLVDTPGFDDSKRSDTEILSLIAQWLQSSYKKDTLLSGIIYLHRISDVRMSGSSIKNLRMFRKLCGSENMAKVCLVTTMWDKVTAEEGDLRERGLSGPDGFWNVMVTNGSTVKRHDGSPESAQNLILDMLDNEPTTIKLQDEIASGKALIDTDAGASINEELLKLQKEHKEDLEAVKEEMSIAMKQGNKLLQKQLQAEHARVISNIKKQADEQYQLQEVRAEQLERELKDAYNARKRLEKGLEAQKEDSRRQEKQANKLMLQLQDASTSRKKLEEGLEAQKKAAKRQEERARKLEQEVKTMSQEKQEAKSHINTSSYTHVTSKPGAKNLKCSDSCQKTFKGYGSGAIKCPYCGKEYFNSEAHWNTLAWTVPGVKSLKCGDSCQKTFKGYGAGAIKCTYCEKEYFNDEAHWNALAWD